MQQREYPHIAVLVAGIDEEYQSSVFEGIAACAKEHQANVACFAAYGGVLGNNLYDIGEYNIYHLANYDQFDGVILLTNTISDPGERHLIIQAVKEKGIPAAVLDSDADPEFYNIRIDNITAMRAVVEHIINFHGVQTVNFISGPLANPEAAARYRAFRDVMEENQLTVDDKRVYFGDFRAVDGRRAIEELLASGMKMPDAVVCANDTMAMEAIATLEQAGFHVPADIIVTGFDNTYYGKHHNPSVTSVSRPLSEAGYTACDTVLRAARGEQCEKTISLSAEPVFMESCGCFSDSAEDMQTYKKETFRLINRCRSDISLLNRMSTALSETETSESYLQVLSTFLQEIGCEQCSICLCEDWQNAFHPSSADGKATAEEIESLRSYSKEICAPLIWTKGEISSVAEFPASELYPVPPAGGGNISFFFPLHFADRCLGYYILTNGDFPLRSMHCHTLMINISHSIENIRKLLHLNNAIHELDRLYVIDPLTGIYNRNGFIRTADQMYRACAEKNAQLLISFIDMDGLKLINDNYGHEEGDFALQRLASVIQSCCTESRICARFGGDEFIIIGTDVTGDEEAERLEKDFKKRIAEVNRIIRKPYTLDASIGTFVRRVDGKTPMFALITEADKVMYEQKKKKKTSRYLRRD